MPAEPPRTLLHVFATFTTGGPQVRFAAIANHFGRRWRHLVVAMDGNTDARERLAPGLDVSFPDVPIRKGDTLGNVRRFRAALQGLRPDLLVTSNWGSIEWAMANRLPLVRHVHAEDGFGAEERDRQMPRRAWTRRAMLAGRDVVVPSQLLWRIATGVWKLAPHRLRLIPNGIDLARFADVREADPQTAAPWPRDLPVIGTVSRLGPEKNIARLVRAFALLERPARLVIVGDGPERGALEALAAGLGIAGRVVFAGHNANPERVLGAIDVFALTSDTEQMPLSILEAMAAARPVAATDVGDIRVMLAAENAPYLAPRDPAALAGRLDALLADPAAWPAIGAANRERARAVYDQEAMFEAWAAIFDGTYQGRRPGAG